MVFAKQVRVDAGIDLDHVHRVLALFQEEDDQKRAEGIYVKIGPDNEYMMVWVRETASNIIVRWVHNVKDGRYVAAWGQKWSWSGTVGEGAN